MTLVIYFACCIFCWITYHRIFSVVYFDVGRGCLGEIVWSAFGGYLLMLLFLKFWYIGAIVAVILLLIKGKKG